jgi:hypothetical protein
MIIEQAPALIGLWPKSRFGPGDEDRAINAAIAAARSVDVPLPVVFGGKCLGFVQGSRDRRRVAVHLAPLGLDNMINAISSLGQRLPAQFNKIANSNLAAGTWWDYYPVGPGAGTYTGAAFTAKTFDDTTAGSIAHGGNVSPQTKHLVSAAITVTNMGAALLLYDRVLAYEACTLTGALQNMTNVAIAARYVSTGQSGLKIMVTTQTAFGGVSNLSAVSYTNQAGTPGQAVPTGVALTFDTTAVAPTSVMPSQMAVRYAAAAAGDVLFLPLAAGDSGARAIASYTTSAAQTGTAIFALVRPLAFMATASANIGCQYDFVRQLATLERIYDGACLHFALNAATTMNATLMGELGFVWSQ